jgi:hypothetical protein
MSQSLIVPRTVVKQLHGEGCGNCRFMHREEGGEFSCRRRAPQVSIILTPAPPPRLGVMPQPFCSFPLVREEFWCGEWEQRRRDAA